MLSLHITSFCHEFFIYYIILTSIISDWIELMKVIESANLERFCKMMHIFLLAALVGKFIIIVLDKIMTIYHDFLIYRAMSIRSNLSM